MSLKHLVEDFTSTPGYKPIAVGNNFHFTEESKKNILGLLTYIFTFLKV